MSTKWAYWVTEYDPQTEGHPWHCIKHTNNERTVLGWRRDADLRFRELCISQYGVSREWRHFFYEIWRNYICLLEPSSVMWHLISELCGFDLLISWPWNDDVTLAYTCMENMYSKFKFRVIFRYDITSKNGTE